MNDHIGEDAELFALGMLEEPERTRVEAHASGCAPCLQRLGEAEAVVARLALWHPPAKAAPRRVSVPRAWMAAAAVCAVAIGVTIASVLQTRSLTARAGANDAILAAIATSHFNHTQFTKVARDAPAAKLLNARRGQWLYVIVDTPLANVRVVVRHGDQTVDLGPTQVHGRTSSLFVRDPGALARVLLERDGSVIETATPSYRDE
jgi:hypothetical protein